LSPLFSTTASGQSEPPRGTTVVTPEQSIFSVNSRNSLVCDGPAGCANILKDDCVPRFPLQYDLLVSNYRTTHACGAASLIVGLSFSHQGPVYPRFTAPVCVYTSEGDYISPARIIIIPPMRVRCFPSRAIVVILSLLPATPTPGSKHGTSSSGSCRQVGVKKSQLALAPRVKKLGEILHRVASQ
jgi:hypothetical protein